MEDSFVSALKPEVREAFDEVVLLIVREHGQSPQMMQEVSELRQLAIHPDDLTVEDLKVHTEKKNLVIN